MKEMSAYRNYRESDLPWVGKIPDHWNVRRNGRLFTERKETGYPDLPILEVSLHTGVRLRDMENGGRKQTMADRSKYKRAVKGDVAYNMMRMWQGAFGVAPTDGLISPAYVIATPFPEVDPRYYSYLFRTGAYKREVNKFSRGIVADRNRLYWDDFKKMPSIFPPQDEQTAIANYLDAHGRQINRLVQNKLELIALLNEQKHSIIDQVVTRGLNPTSKMKEIGIEWMPEIPEHWAVCRLKTIANVVLGKMLKNKPSNGDQLRPYLRSANVQWFRPNVSDMAEMWFSPDELKKYRVVNDDILVSEGGEVGRACIWNDEIGECYIQNSVHKITAGEEILPQYLLYQFFAFGNLGVFRAIVNRVSIAHLTKEKLVVVKFCVPPIEEQHDIIRFLSDETGPIEDAISRTQTEISLIKEYQERIISNVVAGKIDVRNAEIEELDGCYLTEEDALEDEFMEEVYADD